MRKDTAQISLFMQQFAVSLRLLNKPAINSIRMRSTDMTNLSSKFRLAHFAPCLSRLPRAFGMIALTMISIEVFADDPVSEVTEDWYQIEFVLFEHQEGDRHELRYESLPPLNQGAKTYQYYFEAPYFKLNYPLVKQHLAPIPEAQSELHDAFRRLARDPRTKVLQYRAWQQSIAPESASLPLKIDETLDDGYELEGAVTIRRERYLHIDIDVSKFKREWFKRVDWIDWLYGRSGGHLKSLLTALPLPVSSEQILSGAPLLASAQSDSAADPGIDSGAATLAASDYIWLPADRLHFKASRRIKDGERHYIDHPAIAIIAVIKAVESPNAAVIFTPSEF